MLTLAVTKKSGNLNVYYKKTPDFDEYSIESKKWKRQQIAQLTEQEISILKLAKQGMNNKKIADKLSLSYGRLKNIITEIYENLHVKSMSQAVIFATNHLMLFATRLETPIPVKENAYKKRQYHTLNTASLSEMQICLDNEQSINSIAKENGVSEGAIRYAIKHGKLIKDTN
jgi:DNA-binding CsgD family transcriptional regulator